MRQFSVVLPIVTTSPTYCGESSKNNINSADNQSGQKFGFEDQKNGKKEITSDGIEALKPFEI